MDNIIHKEVWIKAPIEEVFKHFTQTEAMLAWHGKVVELNPVPGGVYRVVFESGDEILGTFIKIIPDKFISYSANYWNIQTLVEIHFYPENGGTTVKLRQEFSSNQDLTFFGQGWDYFLGILKGLWEDGSVLKNCT